jgi:cytochrome c biogenesis protein CcmG, thiol:disulfide interchange protein DsbE
VTRLGGPARSLGPRSALLVALAVAVAIVAATGLGGRSATQLARPAPALPTGVLVPPRVTVASLRGRPAAINFWASWCTPCRQEAPALEHLARSLHGRARLVGVDWSDPLSDARAYIERYGWTFPILRDTGGAAGDEYRLTGLPNTFILDPRGRITEVLQGPHSAGALRRALSAAGVD